MNFQKSNRILSVILAIGTMSIAMCCHGANPTILTAQSDDGITWRYFLDTRSWPRVYTLGYYSHAICAIKSIPLGYVYKNPYTLPSSLDAHAIERIAEGAFGYDQPSSYSWITDLIVPEGVKYIESGAFANLDNCMSIDLPESVITYDVPPNVKVAKLPKGYCADAESLEIAILKASVEELKTNAFCHCSQLTNVVLLCDLKKVCKNAFAGCSSLREISIPNSVTNIESGIFNAYYHNASDGEFAHWVYGCTNLASITLPFVGESRGGWIRGKRKTGGFWHFWDVSASYGVGYTIPLKQIRITDETDLGDSAFSYCRNVTNIALSANMENIGTNSFYYCCGLRSMSIPSNVTNIGDRAFYECTSLNSINIGSGVRTIGKDVFANCGNIENIHIPQVISTNTMANVFPASYSTSISKVIISSGTTDIGNSAFSGCQALSSVTIPPTVKSIGSEAFYGCGELEQVFIPDSVETIGDRAFANCSGMKTISLPISLSGKINGTVFSGCDEDLEVIYRVVDDGTYLYWDDETRTPNPPMAKDNNLSITPTTRNFGVNGGGNAIIVSGSSATWTAAVSDPWITLNATSGNVGYPVAYTVSATTNVEQRTGYVYVSGWVHTVTQDGRGATINPMQETFEATGGTAAISVSAENKMVWKAKPNDDWIGVRNDCIGGDGNGTVYYYVQPFDEVSTRQGTLTVAGNTFTVFQYGRRIKLDSYCTTNNYETHVIPITVNALAITQWSVTPNASWISVVDAGNGHGGDLVTIAIAENPSYRARTGTVTIGTETFTVTQLGRPTAALSFSVSPANSTASVEGANGLISVTATPDLPWTATSGANWLTVYAVTANGAGNGNVVYSASPNPTLSQRTGSVTITPEAASGVAAKTHTVTQPAAQSSLSSNGYEFDASGESCSVDVSVSSIVEWNISESLDWITVNGSASRVGPGTVALQAAANNTVYPRSGTVTIAGKTFRVSQKARGVELEYDTKLFGTDGGMDSISIHPDGNSAWTAVASDATWITIFQGDSGTGDGEIMYIVSPYVGNGTARTGWITVGSQKVYITQRAYDLNIEPNGTNVVGNAGAGEFGVSAGIGDVWTAIVTEPWVTLVDGYDSCTGNGVVRFLYTENDTGKTRIGKIIVAGEVYTLEQRARTMVAITATAEHGGHVSGGGSYDLGTQVTLTAVPDSGYAFSYWTGAASSMQNPLTVTADVAKSYTAVFAPLPIVLTNVVSDTNGVLLAWNNLAWAGTYRIYRGVTSVPSSATALVELPNNGNCTYLDETGVVDTEYWYWIEAEGPSDEVMSDPMTGRKEKPIIMSPITYENLRGATNPNPATYREGTLVSFVNPGAVTGYTFAGWMPAQITADMTGAQTVRAAWTANGYSIAYNANGGSGTMNATAATYDSVTNLAANGFTWAGHVFAGWATNATGEVIYAAGQPVTNLTAQSSGVVTLYAVWEDLVVAAPTVAPGDGTVFTKESCMVTLSCATEGADIYYNIGSAPRATSRYLYSGPFTITDTADIYTFARKEGVNSEPVTKVTITKRTIGLAEAAGAADLTFTTGGDANWAPIGDATSASGLSAQSGAIGDESETWLQTSVTGAGTFSFNWKVVCEEDYIAHEAGWDHLEVSTNGANGTWVEVGRIDGTSGWLSKTIAFADAGPHSIRWTFIKDADQEDVFADQAWVCGVTWTPNGTATDVPVDMGGGKSVTVPQTWIEEHPALVTAAGGDVSAALASKAANGRLSVVECYVLGLDPESTTNDFKITSFPLKADGTPDLENIVFDPPEARWNVSGARPVVKGAASLGGEWQAVTEENKSSFRFFKVEVALP